ncbi:MAG: YcxB family protein [bacterium]|nr:YcxB family protein [bacterium]
MVQVKVKMEPADLMRMLRHLHLGQSPRLDRLFFAASLAAVAASVYSLFDPNVPILTFYAFGLLPLLYFAVLPLFFAMSSVALFKKQGLLRSGLEYHFTENGVTSKSSGGSERMEWSRFVKVAEGPKDFFFYLAKAQGFSVPKSATADKTEALKQLLQEHLPPGIWQE